MPTLARTLRLTRRIGGAPIQRAKFSSRFQFRVKSRVLIPAFCKSGVVAGQVIKVRGKFSRYLNKRRIPAGRCRRSRPGTLRLTQDLPRWTRSRLGPSLGTWIPESLNTSMPRPAESAESRNLQTVMQYTDRDCLSCREH